MGNTEASTTRKRSTPCTRSAESTTDSADALAHAAGADRMVHGRGAGAKIREEVGVAHAREVGRERLADQRSEAPGARERLQQPPAVPDILGVLVRG